MLHQPAGELQPALIEVELEILPVVMKAPTERGNPRDLIVGKLSDIQLGRLARDMDSGFPGLHDGPPFRRTLRRVASVYSYIRNGIRCGGRDHHSLAVAHITSHRLAVIISSNCFRHIELFFSARSAAEHRQREIANMNVIRTPS